MTFGLGQVAFDVHVDPRSTPAAIAVLFNELLVILDAHHSDAFQLAQDLLFFLFIAVHPHVQRRFLAALADQQQFAQLFPHQTGYFR